MPVRFGPVVAVYTPVALSSAQVDIDRQAGLHGDDAGDFPAADN